MEPLTPGFDDEKLLGGRAGRNVMLKVHLDDTQQGLIVLRPVGELDAFTVSLFRQEVAQVGGSHVVIDMSVSRSWTLRGWARSSVLSVE